LKAACTQCGQMVPSAAEVRTEAGPPRYDLARLVELAATERAYDETVKVRVAQQDIQRLVAKKRKVAR
jgi:hypothetical protein